MRGALLLVLLSLTILFSGCAATQRETRTMEVTAYCNCGKCCGWERGSWKCLKLDVWNKYISSGPMKGKPYTGRTSSGTKPREPQPGLFSADSVVHPWMIPLRTVFFPWLLFPARAPSLPTPGTTLSAHGCMCRVMDGEWSKTGARPSRDRTGSISILIHIPRP